MFLPKWLLSGTFVEAAKSGLTQRSNRISIQCFSTSFSLLSHPKEACSLFFFLMIPHPQCNFGATGKLFQDHNYYNIYVPFFFQKANSLPWEQKCKLLSQLSSSGDFLLFKSAENRTYILWEKDSIDQILVASFKSPKDYYERKQNWIKPERC